MELVMSSEWQNKYLEEKFKNSEERDRQMMDAIKANTELTEKVRVQAEKTNGRVTKHDRQIEKLQTLVGKKRSPMSPMVLYWIAGVVFLVASMIASAFFNIEIPKGSL